MAYDLVSSGRKGLSWLKQLPKYQIALIVHPKRALNGKRHSKIILAGNQVWKVVICNKVTEHCLYQN